MTQSSTDGQPFYRLAPWKWLTVAILLYSFIAGWFVPLHEGIIEVSPGQETAGSLIEISVTGYNTHYTSDPAPIRAWLRLMGDTVIEARHIDRMNDRELKARFYIPSVFPFRQDAYPMSLIVDHHGHGPAVLPNAIFLKPATEQDISEVGLWYEDKIDEIALKKDFRFPFRNILLETIRNTYFHVPLWFAMIILFGCSAWYSIKYYRTGNILYDVKTMSLINTGVLFGVLGLVTGMIWAKYTWGAWWSWDVKQNMSAIALLIYAALIVLRGSLGDEMQRARLTAGYNMFAFILLIPLLFIIPRMTDSLHPGNGGNPALGGEDLDNTMRLVFYPAVIGFILLGLWISELTYRLEKVKQHVEVE